MSVISRPNELELVTGRPSITQLYGWCVWPVMNRSTSSVVLADDVDDRPGEADAARVRGRVGGEREGLHAALVQQHDDRLDAVLAPELPRVAVGGRRLVEEVEVGDARRRDDLRRPLERHADEADLLALEPADRVGLEERACASSLWTTLAARYLKSAPLNVWPVSQPSVGWQPPRCMRLSSASPSSNSWLPTERDVEPDLVHGLDRRLVVVERRDQRAGADQVAGGDDAASCAAPLELAHVAGEDRGAAGGRVGSCGGGGRRRIDADAAGRGGLEVPVEVVEGQQLDLHVLGLLMVMVVALVRGRGAGQDEQKHAGRPQQAKD